MYYELSIAEWRALPTGDACPGLVVHLGVVCECALGRVAQRLGFAVEARTSQTAASWPSGRALTRS